RLHPLPDLLDLARSSCQFLAPRVRLDAKRSFSFEAILECLQRGVSVRQTCLCGLEACAEPRYLPLYIVETSSGVFQFALQGGGTGPLGSEADVCRVQLALQADGARLPSRHSRLGGLERLLQGGDVRF